MRTIDINILPKLIEGKTYVVFEDVPEPLRKDLQSFMMGETFMPNEKNEKRIGYNLYKAWLEKLFYKGADYDVNLKIDE